MTGYESIMLLCALGTFIVAIASFILELFKVLDKKRNRDE